MERLSCRALAGEKATRRPLPTIVTTIQLLFEGGQHVVWKRLPTLPDVYKLGNLLLLSLWRRLDEVHHHGG